LLGSGVKTGNIGKAKSVINDLWYKNAIIYCFSVGTYMDANGDGIGDFIGLTRRLDYLQGLGITAIWLIPFQVSPGRDDGYDVADYYGVDPRYGTLGDFVELSCASRSGPNAPSTSYRSIECPNQVMPLRPSLQSRTCRSGQACVFLGAHHAIGIPSRQVRRQALVSLSPSQRRSARRNRPADRSRQSPSRGHGDLSARGSARGS
jgi:hypothetical protein